MQEDDTGHDLTASFAAEEANFDADLFVESVMTPIRRKSLRRRIVLSFSALIGGAVAGAQVPNLLSGANMTGDAVSTSMFTLQDLGALTQGTNTIWIAAIVAAVTCAAMVAVMERT